MNPFEFMSASPQEQKEELKRIERETDAIRKYTQELDEEIARIEKEFEENKLILGATMVANKLGGEE